MTLEYLTEGIYIAGRRRVVHLDMPAFMAALVAAIGGKDSPVRRRRVGRATITVLRENGCTWPILLHYAGIAGRQ